MAFKEEEYISQNKPFDLSRDPNIKCQKEKPTRSYKKAYAVIHISHINADFSPRNLD